MAIASKGEKLRVESIRLADRKDENLDSVEKQLLDTISSLGDQISISQLCQFTSLSDRMWEQVRTLYRKGYLDITVNRRE
jgi:D-ribose pyranose/furanose isomerase RbsD